MGKKKSPIIAKNRKAWRDYDIEDTYLAGIELRGSEVKSIRAGEVQFADAFADFHGNELFLLHMHVSEYKQANRYNHSPTRKRKLLLHRSELDSLRGKIERGGMTLVPLDLRLSGRWVKVKLGLGKGRKQRDKREAIKKRMMERDAERAIKEQGY